MKQLNTKGSIAVDTQVRDQVDRQVRGVVGPLSMVWYRVQVEVFRPLVSVDIVGEIRKQTQGDQQ